MTVSHPLFRLTSAVAVLALVGQGASAQTLGPATQPLASQPLGSVGDPPGRVGRVALLAGAVSFHAVDGGQWQTAIANYPVTSGNAFWTQPGASADLDIGSLRVALDQATELDVETLDDTRFVASVPQGEIYLRVRDLAPGEVVVLRTPRGTVTLLQPGRYVIAAGDGGSPTLVTVDDGAAQLAGPGLALQLGPHQTARIDGADRFAGALEAERPDAFLSAQLARDQPPQAAPIPPLPALEQMTGYDAVAGIGEWDTAPDYGQVWYPPVQSGWVPYRDGRWEWVAPWGWTWVDDAPWGFAPFHYGRWVQIRDRWAWAPGGGDDRRPVYAPALVSFVGVAGVAVGLGAAVGWIPLGPREAYRPPYHVSDAYARRVNGMSGVVVTNGAGPNGPGRSFINDRAATMVPAAAMAQSQQIGRLARPVPPGQLAAFQPLARPPVQPGFVARGTSPGPSLEGRRPGVVPLVRANAGASRPAGLPPLAAPGAGGRAGEPHGPIGGPARAAPGPVFMPHGAESRPGAPPLAAIGPRPALPRPVPPRPVPQPQRNFAPPSAPRAPMARQPVIRQPEPRPQPRPEPRQEFRPAAPPRAEQRMPPPQREHGGCPPNRPSC